MIFFSLGLGKQNKLSYAITVLYMLIESQFQLEQLSLIGYSHSALFSNLKTYFKMHLKIKVFFPMRSKEYSQKEGEICL